MNWSSKVSLALGTVATVIFLCPIESNSQSAYTPDAANAGLPWNGVFSGGSIDSVQLQTGNLHIDIPLLHLPGIGMDTEFHFVYDNQVFNGVAVPINNGTDQWNQITMTRPMAGINSPFGGYLKLGQHVEGWECGNPTPVWGGQIDHIDYMTFVDSDGTAHAFPINGYSQYDSGPCTPRTWFPTTAYAEDATGYVVNLNNTVDTNANAGQLVTSLIDKHGRQYTLGGMVSNGSLIPYVPSPPTNPEVAPTFFQVYPVVQIEDSNGNKISGTDTVNRQITFGAASNTFNIPYMVMESSGGGVPGSIQYLDQNGATQTISIGFGQVNINLPMLCGSNCGPAPYTSATLVPTWLPTSIVLQNGDTYTIVYTENGLGEISSITLPTGAVISYQWACCNNPHGEVLGQQVMSRTVTANGQSSTWQFSYGGSKGYGPTTASVIDPNLNTTAYTFEQLVNPLSPSSGLTPRQEVSYSGSATSGTPVVTKTIGYTFFNDYFGTVALPTSEILTWNSTGATTETDTTYDSESSTTSGPWTWGNVLSKVVYDYGTGTHGPLLSNTQYQYLHMQNSAYVAPNIADRVSQASVYNSITPSSSSLVAQATTAYDSFNNGGQTSLRSTTSSPTSQHDYTNYGTSMTLRGLPTSVTKYTGPSSAAITSYVNYNDVGQKTVSTDGRGNSTKYTYGTQNAFLATTTLPLTANGVPHVITTNYDWRTGLLVSQQDFNGNPTGYTYEPLMRPSTIARPDGGSTTYTYPDPNHVISAVTEDSSRTATSTTTLDALGRKISTATTSDSVCGLLTVNTAYDLLGRVEWVTNPHCSSPQVTDGYTNYSYDSIGRLTNKQNPDGSVQSWNITANVVKSIDETDRMWQHTYDAAGRLTKVLEPDGSTNIGNAPTLETDYVYDTLGNLLRVDQWGGANPSSTDHVRQFAYDATSRLIASINPENASGANPAAQTCSGAASGTLWTSCYSYDNDGNVTKKTDNRGISISYTYDALNRVLTKTYSDTTPSATFTYDTSSVSGSGNDIGQMTQATAASVSSTLAQTNLYAFDSMGRLLNEQQCTPATNCSTAPYSLAYTYDWAGKPTMEQFPSNAPNTGLTAPNGQPLVLNYSYDVAERLLTASSNWSDATHPPTLFQASTNFSLPAYGPMGLQNAAIGYNLSAGTTTATIQRGYDMRGRTVNGIYAAGGGSITDSKAAGSITISGSEAHTTKTNGAGSVTLSDPTGGMQYGSYPYEYYYCPGGNCAQGYMMCQTDYYAGTIGVTIQSIPAFSASASWGENDESQSDVRTALINGLNSSGSPVTAVLNGNGIKLTSTTTGISTNYPITVSSTQGTIQQGSASRCN